MRLWYFTLPDVNQKQGFYELLCGYFNVGFLGACVGVVGGALYYGLKWCWDYFVKV